MNRKGIITIVIIVVALAVIGVSVPLGFKIYTDTYEAKTRTQLLSYLESGDVDSTVQLINAFETKLKSEERVDRLEHVIQSNFSDYCSEYDYDQFLFMDKVMKRLDDSDEESIINLSKKLSKCIKSNYANRLLSAIQGNWVRDDNTDLSGTMLTIKTAGKSTTAVLTYLPANKYGFKVGDLKWKNVNVIGENIFSYEDLIKIESPAFSDYVSASATYDFATESINVSVTGIGNGTTQRWIRYNSSVPPKQSTAKNNSPASSQNSTAKKQTPTPAGKSTSNTLTAAKLSPQSDYFFPSDTQYITEADLIGLSKGDVAFIRNEIYARHGYVFHTEPFKSYFSSQSWYIANADFSESEFSKIESKNRDFLVTYEKKQGWR